MGAPFSRSIAGRFVFGFDHIKKEPEVYAVAQEPAKRFAQKYKNVELFYLDKKLSRGTSKFVRICFGEFLRSDDL